MIYTTDTTDELFINWRKKRVVSSYDEIREFAIQFSARRATEIDLDGEAGDMIEPLFRRARTQALDPVLELPVDEQFIKHNIAAYALNEQAVLPTASRHQKRGSLSGLVSRASAAAGRWFSGMNRSMGYVTATFTLLAVVGVSYLNISNQNNPYQESIARMDIPGNYSVDLALSQDTGPLGFTMDNSIARNQFHLGRAFAKTSHIDGISDEKDLLRIFTPYEPVLTSVIQNSSLTEIVGNLSKTSGRAVDIIDLYLGAPAVYLGYWAQNMNFAMQVESDSDIDVLMNHAGLMPALKQILTPGQFAQVSAVILGFQNQPSRLHQSEMQKLNNKLIIWLG